MMEINTNRITVFDDSLSVSEIIMATIMYTFAILPLFYFANLILNYGFSLQIFSLLPHIIIVSFMFIPPAITISEVNTVEIDLSEKNIYCMQKIVLYERTKIIDAEDFEYVALNSFGFGTTVTLWYKGNRHLSVISFYRKSKSFQFAKSLCKILEVDLLDKTDIKNPIWIDKTKL